MGFGSSRGKAKGPLMWCNSLWVGYVGVFEFHYVFLGFAGVFFISSLFFFSFSFFFFFSVLVFFLYTYCMFKGVFTLFINSLACLLGKKKNLQNFGYFFLFLDCWLFLSIFRLWMRAKLACNGEKKMAR